MCLKDASSSEPRMPDAEARNNKLVSACWQATLLSQGLTVTFDQSHSCCRENVQGEIHERCRGVSAHGRVSLSFG